MIAKKWLNYEVGSYSCHSTGSKLVKYINEENEHVSPFSTVVQTENMVGVSEKRLNDRIDELQHRLDAFDRMLKAWIELNDDPWTEEKQLLYTKNPLKIVQTSTN